MTNSNPFLLSISCWTYNQSAYITDAMNGFAMQQTNFPFVAVIIDDASTDGEQDVIKSYIEEHFDHSEKTGYREWETEDACWIFARHKLNENCHFVVALLKRNLFKEPEKKGAVVKEWMDTKYVAICEGDDYWTDPYKLQKQVDILEADKTLMAVVTNSTEVDKEGILLKEKMENVVPGNKQGRYDLRSFMYKIHHYPTATVCYRQTHGEEIGKMTKHMANPYLGDWTMWISLHVFGDFYYLDEVTSAYRINPTSLTHTVDRVGRSKANWTICKAVQEILPDEYDDIRRSLDNKSWMWLDLALAYRHEHQYIRMLGCLLVTFLMDPKGLINEYKRRKKLRDNVNSNRIQ